ncbi:restriction endonuclease subunit S [Budviciaceae bacterium BWR-B9]|uniref:Restriction endonuclease subunit S n=1 Tax=Limnobaculum allomyrinae TaxID=2791986 RepID=A0ABS1IRR6_9GAMM|nr:MULTISPECIES: restriction endonuclease subunit S [Limnobaculum]MBK5144256.1 restriction endonuclease subunit S [Limnobaculum allomyrinae]MBV7691999.1 restriction endonuclease subunit S [Limnobaculum sp. M2-1]
MSVPKLRFPITDSEWYEKSIIDLADYVDYRGKTPNKTDSGVFLVTAKNIKQGYIDYESSQEFIDPSEYDEVMRRGKPKIGDVLITTEAPLGNVATIDKENIALAQRVIKYRGKEKLLQNSFLKQLFLSPSFQMELISKATGGTVQGIKGSVLHQIKVCIPNIKEQTKIANFLSSVDEKISLLNKQYNLLCEYKKSAIQKIFSQELKFRNENGNAYPAWKIKPFRTVYSLLGTNSLSRNELNYENGIIKNIHYGDIHTKFNCRFDINKELVPYISDHIKIAEDNFCRKGDLVIADASEDYNDIGKCIEIMNVGQRQMVAGLHTFLARPSTHMAPGFGCYMMQSSEVRKQIKVIATGVSVLSITKKNLLELMVPLPSIDEQTKIANFLASVDDKIIIKKSELDRLTTWKQGLLQQMFI